MFYNNFLNLCEEKGVSPTRVLSAVEISKGALSRWRDGGEPTNETKKKIADFLGVQIKELNADIKKEKPATINDDELSKDELEFLTMYRKLSPERKVAIDALAKVLDSEK